MTSGFWATVELLTGRGGVTEHSADLFNDDIEDWLETMAVRFKKQQERAKLKSDNGSENCQDALVYETLVECDFSNPPVRSRLEMLMGSNVVRLTDRKYMLRLMARIREDYEKRQQDRIEERKKKELARTKMMILNRFIPVQDAPVEIRRYPLFQLYLYCDSIIEAREKKSRSSWKQVRKAESLYRLLYPEAEASAEDSKDEVEEIYAKRIVVNGEERVIALSAEETVAAKREEERKKDTEKGYILTRDEYERLHYETEAIKDLRETKTVEDMYAKAHEILGILYSYADEGRYGKTEKQQQQQPPETNGNEEEATRPLEGTTRTD